MDSLRILLYIVLIGVSVVSVITHMMRKSDSRSALSSFLDHAKPTRTLTEAERAAIAQAFSVTPTNDAVYQLEGEVTRHGLSSQSNTQWHLLIAGVEVQPFPQWALLVSDNTVVEVVEPPRGDILLPISFNGVTLIDALDEKAREKLVQSRLASGETGPIDETHRSDDNTHEPATVTGRRTETPREAALRQLGATNNVGMALWLGLGLLGTLLLSLSSGAVQWIALPFAVLAAWSGFRLIRTWRAPAPTKPAELRTLYGPLSARLTTVGGDKDPTIVTAICMGEIDVKYPPHWWAAIKAQPEGKHEVEIDLNHHVVKHNRLSLYDELARFPKPRWGRYLTLLIVCVPIFFVASSLSGPVEGSLKSATMRLLGKTQHIVARTPQALLEANPHPGDWLDLHGNGPCFANPGRGDATAIQTVIHGEVPACNALGWNTMAPSLGELTLKPEVRALSALSAQIRPTQRSLPYSPYADALTKQMQDMMDLLDVKLLTSLNARVLDVDTICNESFDGCADLEDALLVLADQPPDWANMVTLARNNELEDNVRLVRNDANVLTQLIDAVLAPKQRAAQLVLLQQTRKAQPTPLVLDFQGDPVALDSVSNYDANESLETPVRTLLTLPFSLTGELRKVSTRDGIPTFSMAPRAERQSLFAVLAPLLIGALALLLAGLSAWGLWRTSRQRAQRKPHVAEYVRQQL